MSRYGRVPNEENAVRYLLLVSMLPSVLLGANLSGTVRTLDGQPDARSILVDEDDEFDDALLMLIGADMPAAEFADGTQMVDRF
jgi:hypothetical protein